MRSVLPTWFAIRRWDAFTLLEVLVCVAIVGLAIAAVMEVITSSTRMSAYTIHRNYAMLLAANAHEYTTRLPYWDPQVGDTAYGPSAGETTPADYDNIMDFATEVAFSPPIDAAGAPISQSAANSGAYTQFISVTPVNVNAPASALSAPVPQAGHYGVPAVRVRVRVEYRPTPTAPAAELFRAQWVRCDD